MSKTHVVKNICRYIEPVISAKERQGNYKGTQRADHNSTESILYNTAATTVQKGRDHATKEKALNLYHKQKNPLKRQATQTNSTANRVQWNSNKSLIQLMADKPKEL